MRLVGRMDAVDHRLDVPLDDRERRSQLVGDVRQEAATLFFVRLEAGGHRVEGANEIANGPGASHGLPNARAVVACLDPGCNIAELVEDVARAADRATRPEEPREDGHCDKDGRDPNQRPAGATRRHDSADEVRADRQEPEEADKEQEPEQAAEAPPRTRPTHRRPRFIGRPPWRPTARASPGRMPTTPPLRRGHGRSSANRYPTP